MDEHEPACRIQSYAHFFVFGSYVLATPYPPPSYLPAELPPPAPQQVAPQQQDEEVNRTRTNIQQTHIMYRNLFHTMYCKLLHDGCNWEGCRVYIHDNVGYAGNQQTNTKILIWKGTPRGLKERQKRTKKR